MKERREKLKQKNYLKRKWLRVFQNYETQQTTYPRISEDPKQDKQKPTLRCIVVKLLKTKDRILKEARENEILNTEE